MSENTPEGEKLPLADRIDAIKLDALASHGYLSQKGRTLHSKVEDIVLDRMLETECFHTKERPEKSITRTALARHVFPNMPGPGEWDDTDDPEAYEEAWKRHASMVWKKTDPNREGRVQARLNGDHSLVLCRTKSGSKEQGVWSAYVTRDWKCYLSDYNEPEAEKTKARLNQQAGNAAMAAVRMPEHAKQIRDLFANQKSELAAGTARIQRVLEAGTDDGDDS